MSLSKADVEKVAMLARLRLSDDEANVLATQLSQVLDYVQQLEQLDTEGVEPLAHPLDLHNVLADDQPHDSLPREQGLAAAPKSDGESFLVPAVLGE